MKTKNKLFLTGLILTLVVLSGSALLFVRDSERICIENFKEDNSVSIFEIQDVITTYMNLNEEEELLDSGKLDLQDNGKDYVNYWIIAERGINYSLAYKNNPTKIDALKESESILNSLMKTYNSYGKFPRPEYSDQNLGYGWVSAMDAPTIMLLSQMIYEITGKDQYGEFVNDLKEYVIRDIDDGGFNYNISHYLWEKDKTWPLEYASADLDSSKYLYVNNGAIVGFLGCKIMALVDNDSEFERYCDNVEKAYESSKEDFLYEKYPWAYYMLNKRTVMQPHYMIFEERLFDAGSKICKSSYWADGYQYRRNAMKSVLNLEFHKTDKGDIGIMRRACAPHSYLIDVYNTEVEFLDQQNNIIDTWKKEGSGAYSADINGFEEGEFLYGYIPDDAIQYNVYMNLDGKRYLLFDDKIDVGGEG